jgi:hypothetical protein
MAGSAQRYVVRATLVKAGSVWKVRSFASSEDEPCG